jgi:hypothetical protein
MKLTIEIGSPSEAEQVLQMFKTVRFETVRLVVEKPEEKSASATATRGKTMVKRDVLQKINRPMAKKLDLDALKKAKNYKGVNRARFNQLVKEINIHEPIELLLSQLSR